MPVVPISFSAAFRSLLRSKQICRHYTKSDNDDWNVMLRKSNELMKTTNDPSAITQLHVSRILNLRKIFESETINRKNDDVDDSFKFTKSKRSPVPGEREFHTTAPLSDEKGCCTDVKKNAGRVNYPKEVEEAINNQIMGEINAAIGYLNLCAYFGRTDVGKMGTFNFFMHMSAEEIEHALILMRYQLSRGGSVQFCDICASEEVECCTIAKALQFALEMEKMVTEKIGKIICLCEDKHDHHTEDWLLSNFMEEQYSSIAVLSRLLAQAVSMGDCGVSEYLLDRELTKRCGHGREFFKDTEKNHHHGGNRHPIGF